MSSPPDSSVSLELYSRGNTAANHLFKHDLLSLPNEIIREILSHFPAIDLPLIETQPDDPYDPSVDSTAYVRTYALRSLSQTSRPMRTVFLPLLWERVDVYAVPGPGKWYKRVSRALEVKSNALAHSRNKELATYVRSVHVVLTRCSTATVIPAFASCLTRLPNLHTLEILYAHSQVTTALKDGFEGISLPSIRKAILPSCAHNILRCCPDVRSVTCTAANGSKLVGAIAHGCPKVEVLEKVAPDAPMIKRIVKYIPNLKRLSIKSFNITPDLILRLSPLKMLSDLDFTVFSPNKDTPCANARIEAARKVLREQGSQDGRPKRLTVRSWNLGQYPAMDIISERVAVVLDSCKTDSASFNN